MKTLDIKTGDYFEHCGLQARKISPTRAIRSDGMLISGFKHAADKITAGSKTRHGYMNASYLTSDGTTKHTFVHRLVAEAFIANPKNFDSVDHINENKEDNRVENLRWTSLHENIEFYNHKENRELLLVKSENKKLSLQIKKLESEKIALTKLHQTLQDQEVATIEKIEVLFGRLTKKLKREAILAEVANKTIGKLVDTAGLKFGSIETMIAATAKPVRVNGVEYQSARAAAKFICSDTEITASEATVRKEIQRYLKGLRPSWNYREKYVIGI